MNDTSTIKVVFSGSRFKYFRDVYVGCWLVYRLVMKVLDVLCEQVCSKYVEEQIRRGLCSEDEYEYCRPCIEVLHGCNPASVDAIVAIASNVHDCVDSGVPKCPSTWSDPRELLRRNREMVEGADLVVCIFVDQITRGTKYVLDYAKKRGKWYIAYMVNTQERTVKVLEHKLPHRLSKLVEVPGMITLR